jgi:hypothetical protein
MVGTCWGCWRPMVAKRTSAELYEGKLDTWFVRKGCNGQCQTCYQRTLHSKAPKKVAHRTRRLRPGSLKPAELLALRLAVGACGECGWAADDNAEPHAARYCSLYQAEVMEGINGCVAS